MIVDPISVEFPIRKLIGGEWWLIKSEEYIPIVEAHWGDVGRNDPCPCGSGKKFKKCCQEN